MPNYDLGTAHGRIKIDVDDRGAVQADRNLADFERTIQSLDRRMAAMQTSLGNMERDLRVIANDFRNAAAEMEGMADSADHLDSSLRNASVASRAFSGDIRSMITVGRQLKSVFDEINPKVQMFRRFYSGFSSRNGGFTGVVAGLSRLGVASMGLNALKNHILGVNKVMSEIPNWQKHILRLSTVIGGLGSTILIFPKMVEGISKASVAMAGIVTHSKAFAKATGAIKGFAAFDVFGKVIQGVAKHSQNAGLALAVFEKRAKNLGAAMGTFIMAPLTRLGEAFGLSAQKATSFASKIGSSFQSISKETWKTVLGFNLLKSGISDVTALFSKLGWVGKIAFGMIGSAMTVGPALMDIFSKALVGTSNLIIGLWNGIKQLSGAFLALPGAVSMALAGFSTMAVVFSGLKDSFKGIFKGGADAVKALAEMPPHLRGIGQAIFDLMPKFKDLRTAVQSTFFTGMEKQIKDLAGNYLPLLQDGMGQVANSMRNVKDKIVGFLNAGSTQRDTSALYASTARAIESIGQAVQPALTGLKDISVVGAQFFDIMSARMPSVIQKFADWAAVNRENGNLLKWMQDSWTGAKNLTNGMLDLIRATGKLLTLFATNNGDNFLSRFAASMKHFNETVQSSAASGTLRKIADTVKSMGTEHLKAFVENWGYVNDAIKAVWPSVKKFTDAMSSMMMPVIKLASLMLQGFFKTLNFFHLDGAVAFMFSLSGALFAVWKICGPLITLVKTLYGAFLLFRGVPKILTSISDVLYYFGSAGRAAAAGVSMLAASLNAVMIAVAAAIIAWTMYKEGQNQIAEATQAVADASDHAKESVKKLKESFAADRGMAGKNVFEATSGYAKQTLDDMKNLSDKAPGILGNLVDFGSGGNGETVLDRVLGINSNGFVKAITNAIPIVGSYLNMATGQSDTFNKLQAVTEQAKMAKSEFDKFGISYDQLSSAVQSSNGFETLRRSFEADGEEGQAAIAVIDNMRQSYVKLEAEYRQIGPAGADVVSGIKQIADAAGNADEKLNGLKRILEGLGILQTSALEKAAEYAQSIDDLSKNVTDALDPTKSLNDIIDAQGKLNVTASANARNLLNVLAPLGEQYLTIATSGGDANKAYEEFAGKAALVADQINNMAGRIVITKDQVAELSRSLGMIKPQDLAAELNKFLNGPNKQVLIDLGIDQATINKLNQQLQNGIKVDMLPGGFGNPKTQGDGPHGGYGDRARQQEKDQQTYQEKSLKEWQAYLDGIKSTSDAAASAAKDSGAKFVEEYARGIRENKAAQEAADVMAAQIKARFHQSPPKTGPLAAHGDAAKYGGKMFVSSYSTGLANAAPVAAAAAGKVAGAAGGAVSGYTSMGSAAGQKAGRFLGQLLDLTNFAQSIRGIFSQVTDTFSKMFKFISDPMGKGTFFGKPLGFKKTVSDEVLRKQREDAIQSQLPGIMSGGQRDTSMYNTATAGMKPVKAVGDIAANASKADIQNKIIYEARKRGMNDEQIKNALAIAQIESAYKTNADGGIQPAPGQSGTEADRALGLYQQKSSWGTVDQRLDPNYAINKFLEAYQQQLAKTPDPTVAAVLTQNPQLGANAVGSDYYNKTKNAYVDTNKDFANFMANPANISPTDVGLQLAQPPTVPTTFGANQNYTPDWMMQHGFAPLFQRDSQGNAQIPAWAQQMAAQFNLGVTSHLDSTLHGGLKGPGNSQGITGGWGFDFSGPKPDMERFAQFLQQNMMADLAQLIHRSPTTDYGVAGGENVGGPVGQGRYYTTGQGYNVHDSHVHAAFFRAPGVYPATATMPGTSIPSFLQGYNGGDTNQTVIQQNPKTGAWEVVDPHGKKAGTAPGDINPVTQQPFTDAEKQALMDAMPLQYTLPQGMTMDQFQKYISDSNYSTSTPDQMLSAMNNPSVQAALAAKAGGYQGITDAMAQSTLAGIDAAIATQQGIDTPAGRAQLGALQSLQSDYMSNTGYTRNQNPIDQISGMMSNAAGVASDVIGTIVSGIEAIGAGKDIADVMVRGVANTKDINRVIDDVQKFIDLGGKVAGSVASVTGLIGSVGAGADPSGASSAISAVSTVASLVQAGFQTANAVIDLTQEASRIVGTYFGDFLGYLTGGTGGPLAGNVKFLLDQQTNQLLTYSADNPLDKRIHDVPFAPHDQSGRSQLVGNINVYGGPGSDPRDLTRQMMFQVNSAQYAGALAQ